MANTDNECKDLYVNDFSIDMGDTGKNAIKQLEKVWSELNNQ